MDDGIQDQVAWDSEHWMVQACSCRGKSLCGDQDLQHIRQPGTVGDFPNIGLGGLCQSMNKLTQIYFDAAGGNFNASVFITAFHAYCHAIDDLIDGETPFTPETLLDVLMQANAVYSTPFYIENHFRLQPVIASITNTYADSVAWEKADDAWKRNIADVIRQCGNEMILVVAWIVGGFKHMRAISLRLREFSYHSQH